MAVKRWVVGAVVATAWVGGGCAEPMRRAAPWPIEVWRGGDDGLTSRFADAVEDALRSSPAFVTDHGKEPRTLVLTIPTNLRWKEVGSRTRVSYEIVLTDAEGRRLG